MHKYLGTSSFGELMRFLKKNLYLGTNSPREPVLYYMGTSSPWYEWYW